MNEMQGYPLQFSLKEKCYGGLNMLFLQFNAIVLQTFAQWVSTATLWKKYSNIQLSFQTCFPNTVYNVAQKQCWLSCVVFFTFFFWVKSSLNVSSMRGMLLRHSCWAMYFYLIRKQPFASYLTKMNSSICSMSCLPLHWRSYKIIGWHWIRFSFFHIYGL